MRGIGTLNLSALTAALLKNEQPQSALSLSAGISQNSFNSKLEKHISDVKHGIGDLTKDVNSELNKRSSDLSTRLTSMDPRALRFYSGIVSALRYDRAARLVSNLEYATKTLAVLASEDLGGKKASEIINAYNGKISTKAAKSEEG